MVQAHERARSPDVEGYRGVETEQRSVQASGWHREQSEPAVQKASSGQGIGGQADGPNRGDSVPLTAELAAVQAGVPDEDVLLSIGC